MQKIAFEDVLAEKRKIVWQEIQKYLNEPLKFPGKLAVPTKYNELMDFHWEMTTAYPKRLGKYLRPTLVLLTAEAMGVLEEKALLTAAAMQTSEDWILIHDDLEDHSLQRRGQPALQEIYGTELSVNAGDTLQTIMWKMILDNFKVCGEKKGMEIANEFNQILMRTTFGQTLDIKWTKENKQNLTDEDIFLVLDGKTSYYSVAGPMRLGAILCGATPAQLEKIWVFGQYLGRCFQILDDLLDLTSDFKGLKKQTGNDIYEGKRTIMLAHLLRTVRGSDKSKLVEILKKTRDEKTEGEIKWVIEKMEEYKSLQYGQELAEKLAMKAKDFFEKELGFLFRQPARDQLKSGINFILNRKY